MDTANEALSQLNRYYSKDPTNRAPEIHDAYRILRQCIAQIPELEPSQVPETSQNLDDLCSFAYKSMQAQSEDALFHVNIRQAYTDGCIAWVLLRSIVATNQVDEDLWIQCIQKLDGALVFSSGPNRLDLVHALIQHIQQTRLPIEYTTSFKPLIPPEDIAQVSLPPCGRSVPRIEEPDLISFLTTHCKSPFVVSNGVSHWPALNDHPWSSVEYLNSVAGKGRLVPVEIGKDYRVDSWSQQMMDWDELLKRTEDARPPLVYLAQHSLLSQFPALRDDVQIPDLVYSSPTSEFPKYTPPTNEDGFIINAWLGPKGTTSPAHQVGAMHLSLIYLTTETQDPYFNCYGRS